MFPTRSQPFLIRRRTFLAGTAGLALSACGPQLDDAGTPRRIARQVDQTLQSIARTELAADPELATRLGLTEEQVGYDFNRYLTDRSQAAYERNRVSRLEILEALSKTPRPAEGSSQARHLDTVTAAYETAETLFVAGHGQTGLGISYPYVMDHMRGAYIDVPDLLTRSHPFRKAPDAAAYVDRLAQFADALDDERRRMNADAQAGVLPPDFILVRMAGLATAFAGTPAASHVLVTTMESQLAGVEGLSSGDASALLAKATGLVGDRIFPAYQRLASDFHTLQKSAPSEPGVWQHPDGDAYYDASLAAYTDEGLTAEQLHALGLAEVDRLTADLQLALFDAGLTEGSVTARLQMLAAQPGQVYPDTPEGRQALLDRMRAHLADAEAALPRIVSTPVRTPVAIRAVPDFLTASAPAAFYSAATADGSAPGLFEINLSDMTDWPDFTLATLVFHETVPGHHLESALTAEQAHLPLIRQMIWNVAYGEGWGVYAETLADELGLYQDDPISRIGYLQSLLFRAARLVADTGIHRLHWTRKQATDYLVAATGQPDSQMAQEVDRYTVWPGQAAAYWIGRKRILDLKERAERVLGPDFDFVEFHDAILTGGPRPLSILENDIERWYAAKIRK
ncbi:MAG TPA: DUF885 domain-containing protein [Hyphomonas sp.]|nr:DUF885 domain-containing protein [Hyphomonas sp.]MCB9963047.1 DUF885 domain-containing protein [Hyphomonas sp.]MCB9972438.1 DUF885 domain-containing protein [Hyphomonas sp.]MCC0017715.1 DUF885 domain-containing protein [Rhodobiaceae bacterium]HPE47846.1 DUF885 domain-containing protein [Hyphomonas sp.]